MREVVLKPTIIVWKDVSVTDPAVENFFGRVHEDSSPRDSLVNEEKNTVRSRTRISFAADVVDPRTSSGSSISHSFVPPQHPESSLVEREKIHLLSATDSSEISHSDIGMKISLVFFSFLSIFSENLRGGRRYYCLLDR